MPANASQTQRVRPGAANFPQAPRLVELLVQILSFLVIASDASVEATTSATIINLAFRAQGTQSALR